MTPPKRVEMLGASFDALTLAQTLDLLVNYARGNRHVHVITANVDHVVRLSRSEELRALYAAADLVVADGMPLIWASKLLGCPLPERVAGSDLFPRLCERAAEQGLSVYFLGGASGAAQRAAEVLVARHPLLRIAGLYCPPFGFESDPCECERIVGQIQSAAPDILFVGLGSPKQETWIHFNRARCGAKLCMGIGIAFSFLAGDVKRAPKWMQNLGLEWLHRVCQEPARLWRRYFIDDLAFFVLVMRARGARVRGRIVSAGNTPVAR